MNVDRIKLLEKYIKEDPTDPFPRYALSLELAHQEPNEAINLLLKLIKDNPHYVPSYYQAAVLLLEQNRLEETKIVIEQGIIMARNQKDNKATAELKQLQDEIE